MSQRCKGHWFWLGRGRFRKDHVKPRGLVRCPHRVDAVPEPLTEAVHILGLDGRAFQSHRDFVEMRAKGTRGRVRMRIGRVFEFVQERLLVNQPRVRNSGEGEVLGRIPDEHVLNLGERVDRRVPRFKIVPRAAVFGGVRRVGGAPEHDVVAIHSKLGAMVPPAHVNDDPVTQRRGQGALDHRQKRDGVHQEFLLVFHVRRDVDAVVVEGHTWVGDE